MNKIQLERELNNYRYNLIKTLNKIPKTITKLNIPNQTYFSILEKIEEIKPINRKKLVNSIENFFVPIIGEKNKIIPQLYNFHQSNSQLIENMHNALKNYRIEKNSRITWFPLQDDGTGYEVNPNSTIRGKPNDLFSSVNVSAVVGSLDNTFAQMNPVLAQVYRDEQDINDILSGKTGYIGMNEDF